MVAWGSFGDVVDKYVEGDTWRVSPAPHQNLPQPLATILRALDRYRPNQWLHIDSNIRDLGGQRRNKFGEILSELKATLHQHPIRRFLIGDEAYPMLISLCCNGAAPSQEEVLYQGQVSCLAVNFPRAMVLRLTFSNGGAVIDVACGSVLSLP